MPGPIPEKIRHDDFLAAMKPLLDLLSVTAEEVHADIHIGPSPTGNIGAIKFNAIARAAGDDSDYPQGQSMVECLAPGPQPYTELAWPVTVEIV